MPTRVELEQLAQDGATTGQAPVWNGTKWAPATVASGGGGGGASLAADGVVDATKALSSADTRIRGPFTRNYVTNPDAEIDTTGWATYADAAGVQPVDGTGGSPVVTWTRTTTTPLAGLGSFLLTKDAVNRQGQGAGIPITIQREDCGKSLSLGGNAAVASGTYTPGEVSLWVLDVTSGKLCPISSGNTVQANGSFNLQFMSSSSTSYRLIVHIGGTSALAYSLQFDDFYIGAVYLPGMPAMSDDRSYVPAIVGMGTVTGLKASWQRVGNRLRLAVRFDCGTPTATTFQLPLPDGLTADPNVYSTTVATLVGKGTRNNTAAANGFTMLAIADGRTYLTASLDSFSGVNPLSSANGNGLCNAGEAFTCFAEVAIQGWSGSTAVQPGSRYLWAQRFAAVATRVTTDPSAPGQYRALRAGVDTAPNTAPTVADGFRTDKASGIAAGNIDRYKVFVGKGKVVQLVASSSVGRTGIVCYDLYYNTTFTGMTWGYDPTTGVVEWDAIGNSCGITIDNGVNVLTAYVDILVADDPVPVAMANQVSALTDWQDAGPVTITAVTTNPTKGTIGRDKVWWRRVGDSMQVRIEFWQSGAGTAGSGNYKFAIPGGYVADTNKIYLPGATDTGLGSAGVYTGTQFASGFVTLYDATNVGLIIGDQTNAPAAVGGAYYAMSAANMSYMVEYTVPIVGWSATQVVQLGSRYLWAQRYAATATRVTGPPSRPGEYRARRLGTDTAPTSVPSVADGFRIDSGSGIAAGRINVYDVYVGPGKVVSLAAYRNAGRTGGLQGDFYVTTVYVGTKWSYDPTTGVVTFGCYAVNAGDCTGVADDFSTTLTTGYFDLLIADDPVPVAQADQLSALTDWQNAGATTISWSGGGGSKGTTSLDSAKWRRVGDSAEIEFRVLFSGAGTAGTGIQLFTLPAGLVADPSLATYTGTDCAAAQQAGVGDASLYTTTGAVTSREGFAYLYSTTQIAVAANISYTADTSNRAGVLQATYWAVYGSGDGIFIRIRVKILGWSGTQAVQLGTRFLWAERFAATATRVAAPPSGTGQYRAMIRTGASNTFTDNAPTTSPSATDGFRLFSAATYTAGDTSGQPSRFVIYVGPGKIVDVVAYKSAGRTGFAASLGLAGSAFYYGYVWNYDYVAGTVTIEVPPISSATSGLAAGVDEAYTVLSSIYFDLIVADDPVPVAMEDQLSALTDWQDYVPTITGLGTVTNLKASWRRVGDTVSIRATLTTGTCTAVVASMTLPTGISFDNTKMSNRAYAGWGQQANSGLPAFAVLTDGATATDKVYFNRSLATVTGLVPENGNSVFYNSGNISFVVENIPVVGWSGTQVVQPGTRYRWAERFGATATRVTGTPTGPGQYRARRLNVDTAPTTPPSVASGLFFGSSSAIGAGTCDRYDVFVGTGKIIQLDVWGGANRTIGLCRDFFYNGTLYYGTTLAYDSVTGVATVWASTNTASDLIGGNGTTNYNLGYFDFLIADDPVPVALTTQDTVLRTASARNYVSNPNAETDTTGWATYADAAGSLPVDGTGGSASITWTRTTTSPLSGVGSFLLTKDAVNRQGQGASCTVTIDNADRNRSLTLAGSVEVVSGTFAPGDITLHVLDTSTGFLCPISGSNGIQATGEFAIQFSSNINTAYRLIVHVASVSAAAYSLRFDNFYVGPVYLPSSPAMSDWQSFTPTITNVSLSGSEAYWRRNGDTMECIISGTLSGAPTGEWAIVLPNGAVPNLPNNARCDLLGVALLHDPGVSFPPNPYNVFWSGTAIVIRGAVTANWNATVPITFASGDEFSFNFRVPIVGWSGSTAVQPGSRYLWAQRFAAQATYVVAPANVTYPGAYHSRRSGAGTVPTTGPSAGDGVRIDSGSGIAAGRINEYWIYIGPGKIVQPAWYKNAGRTGRVTADFWFNSVNYGTAFAYDPVTGVAYLKCFTTNVGDAVGYDFEGAAAVVTAYFDLLVADDPVPVAQAPAVHVEASSDAGQVVVSSTTNLQYEDETTDTHGAWSTDTFSPPVPGRYLLEATAQVTAAVGQVIQLYRNGTVFRYGSTSDVSANSVGGAAFVFTAYPGETYTVRVAGGGTRSTTVGANKITITRIGDA